jgi:hypothetical protein
MVGQSNGRSSRNEPIGGKNTVLMNSQYTVNTFVLIFSVIEIIMSSVKVLTQQIAV